ncbi:MAG: hypothetical protein AMXMBFR81_18480 [Chthonomonas sp.]
MKQGKEKEALYDQIISQIFAKHFKAGLVSFKFKRQEIIDTATELRLDVARNVGDVIYTFRFRKNLPKSIRDSAPKGSEWVINLAGRGQYEFELVSGAWIKPSDGRVVIKVPDSTPVIIAEHALSDEQALLAVLRYNRLIDTFLRATCFSLQSHLRTQVKNMGQIEVDELYLGVDRRGVQYVIPVQAKGGKDKLGIVQVRQDMAFCRERFPHLTCRPVAAQFMKDSVVALMELVEDAGRVLVCNEAHFRLVASGEISSQDLDRYRAAGDD